MRNRMRAGILLLALCACGATGSVSAARQNAPAATTVIHFNPPATTPSGDAVNGSCTAPSGVARSRADAWTCVAGATTYDPCFRIEGRMQVWCLADPRQPGSGTLIALKTVVVHDPVPPSPLAWFFELTDGSTCRPLAAPGRTVEGERELYACKYGSAGEADAVLGELDSTESVWTIHKVLINKKAEPQTVKSLAIAPVRTVWR